MRRLSLGNFTLELGMEVVQEYLNQVVTEFLSLVVVLMCFWSAHPTVLSKSIEQVNCIILKAKVNK